jgi:cytidine deaminase
MAEIPTGELIATAASHLNPHRVGDRLFGDVAATLVTDSGAVFSGVCIDTSSGTGFCAEHAAIAAMVTAGEYRVAKIVAVWRDDADTLYVLPPCGRCREFIRQVDPANVDAEIVLAADTSSPLRDLLPLHEWPPPLTPPTPSPSDNRGQ